MGKFYKIIIIFSSLIIDDIEDGSDFRRKKECIHKIYGIDIAVNAGNSMYYIPLMIIKNNKKYSTMVK